MEENKLIQAIEEYEDEMLAKKAHQRLQEMKKEDLISWEEAIELAGWKKGKGIY